jgi:hypothetical protein
MDYFSKLSDEGDLIVTTISDETEVIQLSGDYIKIWELIQSSEINSEAYKNCLLDPSLAFLKPFLNFLYFNKFWFLISENTKTELITKFKPEILGSFKIYEEINFEVFAQITDLECSANGTDAYNNAEAWIAGCSGYNEWQ